ncbi:hypothetical protein [Streptomyces turgidiscabies]|uniref:Uncharacterized protein n=1 Tax=Streptomyces turgidiscabies TaxID=85558 RepID=A0ABU0RM54_9ACTN|nr:hypothetical protein [Streptomyces turgidiscabies]MDQ0932025.1 hypothetical protein [Streptomyces turgidiscabies]
MSATEDANAGANTPDAIQPKPYAVPGVSMRDLLAAGAAARAVSTPPRPPRAATVREQSRAA